MPPCGSKASAEADPFGMVIGSMDGELKYINPVLFKHSAIRKDDVGFSGKGNDGITLTPPEYAAADAKAVEQLRASGRCEVY